MVTVSEDVIQPNTQNRQRRGIAHVKGTVHCGSWLVNQLASLFTDDFPHTNTE